MTLRYSTDSPSGLFRGRDKIAGYRHSSGYWIVRVSGQKIYAQRVVWELNRGPIPEGMIIDHRDGNGFNNAIDNLRLATHRINSRNMKMNCRNKTGTSCVFYRESRGSMFWVARWREENKTKEKHFSVNKYGEEEAKRLAIACREAKVTLEEGYTERHGR